MTWSVHQHWDPLRVCRVGRSYPPEFYSWIEVPHVRTLFERMAQETEEDYQNIIKKLESFGVEVLRPDLPEETFFRGTYTRPPMVPRDYSIMVGETFYLNNQRGSDEILEREAKILLQCYDNVKDASWPTVTDIAQFAYLPDRIVQECAFEHNLILSPELEPYPRDTCYNNIIKRLRKEGNKVKFNVDSFINGAMISRIGKDLYHGTMAYDQDPAITSDIMQKEFPDYRRHIVNTGGHSDGTFCAVAPGLIISLYDVPTYAETFPGWEVVYLPGQSWDLVKPFLDLKRKNQGKWWIPGFEQDQDVVDIVETWMGHWIGYVEETVFDVNMLIIDPKNVIVFNYNDQVLEALHRHGITAHVLPFRHRYFWDGGIHCVTSDLHREGRQQDWFPERSKS